MKRMFGLGSHLLASLFLFYCIGLGLDVLLIQSKFVDMRLDSEYVITCSMLVGLCFYLLALTMEARNLIWWGRKKTALLIVAANAFIVLLTTIPKNALFMLPALSTRKAWLLESVLSVEQMNVVLLAWIIIGIVVLFLAFGQPLNLESEGSMKWDQLGGWTRTGIFTLFGMIILFLFFYLSQGGFRYAVNEATAMLNEANVEAFRDYLVSFGPYAVLVSAVLMILSNIVAPLPGFVITFTNGLLFGWIGGAALSWGSAMLGAMLCFYLARFLGRPFTEKLVSRAGLEWADRFFIRYGKQAVLIARLLPFVSFDVVSYAAGLTSMRFWTFFWATGIGQLPATLLYSYLGKTATGMVKILFILFVIVLVLIVLGAIFRPKWKQIGIDNDR
jgi:uncharacterized membrane protein YdjX (TVP38/TMEM64 family)